MAGPRTCRSPRCNPPPGGKDELARGPPGAPTEGSNTPIPFPPVSRAQTPADAPAPTLVLLRGTYTDKDLQRTTKLALESFVQGQAHTQRIQAPRKACKGSLPRSLLGQFSPRLLLLLSAMRRLFRDRWRERLQPYPLCGLLPPRIGGATMVTA